MLERVFVHLLLRVFGDFFAGEFFADEAVGGGESEVGVPTRNFARGTSLMALFLCA